METYEHLKILTQFSSDTSEERFVAHEVLNGRKFMEGGENIDKITQCIEGLLDKASPGLPANVCNSELQYHVINVFQEKVLLQLNLLPQENYQQ